jgi:hypothetical protein
MDSALCLPARIYLILAITGVIASVYNKLNIIHLLFSIVFVILWTNILNWFCNRGFMLISWFLVMLPIFSAFTLAGIYMSRLSHNV